MIGERGERKVRGERKNKRGSERATGAVLVLSAREGERKRERTRETENRE